MRRFRRCMEPDRRIIAPLIIGVGALACGWAHAGTTRTLSGSIGATSDGVYRGLSYTRGQPAALGSVEIEFAPQLYAGMFATSVDPNRGESPGAEVDAWAGWHWSPVESLSGDLRLTHYAYPNDPRIADYDRDELTVTFGLHDAFFLGVTYSPNTEAIGSNAAGVTDG